MIDLAQVRADTAGCEDIIHLNNSGSSLPPRAVVDAMVGYLRDEELRGGYEVFADRNDELELFHTSTAELLGCSPGDVAFTSSGSDGWWRAFSSVPLDPGDRILVSRSEYQSNAFGWLSAQGRGVTVDVVPNTPEGDLDVAALQSMLDEDVALVSMTMISMSNGAVQPVSQVGDALANHRAIFLVDACQAAGQLRLDVGALGCDFLVYTGRKFMRGPRGTGALYVRPGVLDQLGAPAFLDGRSAVWTNDNAFQLAEGAKRYEFGEVGFGGKLGLAVATKYLLDIGIDAIEARVQVLSTYLRQGLASAGITVLDEGTRKSGIVTFNREGVAASVVQAHLAAHRINVSAPERGNAQLDIGARGIDQLVRAGVHYFNTESELDKTLEVLSEV